MEAVLLFTVLMIAGSVLLYYFTRWTLRLIFYVTVVGGGVALGILVGFHLLAEKRLEARNGPERTYLLREPAAPLSEATAYNLAMRTLVSEPGFYAAEWKPVPIARNARTATQTNRYLWLTSPDASSGVFSLTNASGQEVLMRVEAEGEKLRARRVVGK